MAVGSRLVLAQRAAASLLLNARLIGLAAIFTSLWLSPSQASPSELPPFASMYADPRTFVEAIAKEERRPPPGLYVTGISVPHHLLASDLIARGFQAAAGNRYDRVIIVSPDHFSRSRRPMATTQRDINTVFGPVRNDREATGALLQATELFDDSALFATEHGIQALLPFVRHFLPNAKIVPIAISYSATREQCDRALTLIERLVGPHTLVVQSTDYSHYLPADVARRRDQETLNIIAANDARPIFRLLQPDHIDSRAAQYMQMQLQKKIFKSFATVIANRNSAEYSAMGTRTTSYVVTVYSTQPPVGADLRYPDQKVIYFAGDTFIGRFLTVPMANQQAAASVERAIKTITAAAPMVVNLEGVVMREPPQGTGDDQHVMYASLAIPILKNLNVTVADLANNHGFDLGAAGLAESRSILQRSGIVPLGHKEVIDLGPLRLLGLNFIGKFGYRDYPMVKDGDLEEVCQMTAQPPLLAFVHWGHEYTNTAGAPEYAAAQSLHECGVDAVIGSHSHQATPQIEAMEGGEYQLTYSLGNFLFDQMPNRTSGALLELRAFKQGTYATRLISIPNLFELAAERLQADQQGEIKSPQTNSARSKAE
jgi:AmmeMemoRadiSam system protein B